MSGDVPEGWGRMELGSLIEPSRKKAEPADTRGRPYLGLEHIESGTNRVIATGDSSEVKSTTAVFSEGDVLFSKLRPYLNKVAIAPFNGVGSTEILVFEKRPYLDSKYLMWLLSRQEVVRIANDRAAGVQLPRITFEKISDIEVPVAPLPEQHRIVEKVEALLEQVNRAKERLDRVPLILKRFRQAVLAAACSGELTKEWRVSHAAAPMRQTLNGLSVGGPAKTRRGVPDHVEVPESLSDIELPDTWTCISVAECLRNGALIDVKDGNHGANHPKVSDFGTNGLPFVTAAQVGQFTIDYEGAYKVAGKPLKALRVGFAHPGDAILTHKGSVGRSALCSQDCVLTPQTTYYRANATVLSSSYLVYLFASPQFYAQLAAVMSQTTRDFVPISEQYRLFLLLPPLPEQEEIARRLDGLLAVANAIDHRVRAATAQADKLPQAILSKAFSGELVPTEAELARLEGRTFETAEELLKRVVKSDSTEASTRPARGRRVRKAG